MYQRIESRKGYDRITTVDHNGDYKQIVQWRDGIITSHYESNIFKMGWHSLQEFLQNKPNFKEVIL